MRDREAEAVLFRRTVSCAALLEGWRQPWRLDRRGSTRNAPKYRRGDGEVLIVSHQGRGWWDPQSQAKGDVFDLVQFLDPSLNFGEVRQVLRRFVGVAPSFPEALRETPPASTLTHEHRWSGRPRLRRGAGAWAYLAEARSLPGSVLAAAAAADAVREGPYGSAWFAHRDDAGSVTHIEIRGPDFRGAVRGGTKTLFRLPGGEESFVRLAVNEGAISALSLAAIEALRPDTLHVATGGGIGSETARSIARLLTRHGEARPVLVAATDADLAGERHAARLAEIAAAAGAAFQRLTPPIAGGDWNDVLRQQKART